MCFAPKARQDDSHQVRLTANALRGLALTGQSRCVLQAHYDVAVPSRPVAVFRTYQGDI